ncbi:hypothetical protein B9Z19DRAFT_1068047 [Tuber borchii]|uniref:DUF7082 domain-containing protein n=1 Tax=Tuber borchii TaxID=42251 RepID=A0A2T6ZGM4_TUBBO|nr:hypothetical protein B9Z19DRAFT_1068047 [Tuber borchii]
MSAYGKSPQQQAGYDTRPSQTQHLPNPQQPAYGYNHPQTHYVPPTQQPSHISHGPPPPQQHPSSLSEPAYPSQSFEDQGPRVVGYRPTQGVEGGHFSVLLQSPTDLTTDSRSFRFMFGSRRCNTTVRREESAGMYRLTGEIPAFSLTGWVAPQVTVYLNIEDADGQELDTFDVGTFTYTDQQSFSSPPRVSRKRKHTAEPDDSSRGPAKRPTSQPIRPKSEDYGYSYSAPGPSGIPPFASHSNDERSYLYSGYSPEQSAQGSGYRPQTSPRAYGYPSYPAGSSQPAQAGQPWVQPYPVQPSSAHPSAPRQMRSDTSPNQPPASLPSPSNTPNPTLIRTSTLQQAAHTAPPSAQGGPSGTGTGFNPYGLYPEKAVLDIQGELGDMARNWNPEEWDSRRRLVQFWRRQKGSTIHTTFRPVAPNDRQPNSICISCIWWAEKSECFVTSVDCIYLLESLIAVRFTVEEKNRIRRNLEGFRPLTVSKAKSDSENFFKLIMAFPNPKPRNIEKDVKVFPWSVLGHALKKIIGKYCASYSSTASVIPTAPGASAYPGGSVNEASQSGSNETAVPPVPSPPTVTGPTSSSSGPSASLTGTAGPPPIKQPSATSSPPTHRPGGSSELPAQVPALPPPSAGQQGQQPIWHPHQPLAPSQQQQISAQGQRTSWDLTSYLDPNTASGNTAGAQVVHYPHGPVAAEGRESVSGAAQQGQLPGDVS